MTRKPLVLICDDDPEILKGLQLALRSNFEVHTSTGVVQAKSLVSRHEYDAAIIDLCFEGQEFDGVHLLDHFNRTSPGTLLIVLSGDSSTRRVVEATRRKLFEFISKEDGDYFTALLSALNRSVQLKLAREQQTAHKFLTHSRSVLKVLEMADKILRSESDASILILGETGSGKEILAQHLAHGMKKTLLAANMGSIPRETAESILFGHERGAFTGAIANKVGLIEAANDGVVFLDEIGECSSAIQAKLLRVLQEKEILPLGSNKPRKIRVQFIAATHRNLEEMVENGSFRLDLLQRLNTFTLRLPPLRERPEDILLYTDTFLDEVGSGSQRYSLTTDGAQALLSHQWPGNIRELKSVIQRILVLSDKLVLDSETVNSAIGMGKDRTPACPGKIATLEANVRRDELMKALQDNRGSIRRSSKVLGVSEATLYRWVNQFGLSTVVNQCRIDTQSHSKEVG